MPSFCVRAVHKQVSEIAKALCAFHGSADILHILLTLCWIGNVHDETRMVAVKVIHAAEQRGLLFQRRLRGNPADHKSPD